MSEALVQLGEEIKAALPGAVTEAVVAFEELTVHDRTLKGAIQRGAWDGTKFLLEQGRDWIIDEMKKTTNIGKSGTKYQFRIESHGTPRA